MEKFVALFDLHWGYERKGGHKVPLHDLKALNVALSFIKDFKPDHIILGGDILDCGPVSHHNERKPGLTEGLKIVSDAKELRETLLKPLEASGADLTYIVGNHEDWLTQLTDKLPALEGMMDIGNLLDLDKWNVVEQGGTHKLGKLLFMHGDQLSGGEHVAKAAVTTYEQSVRFGHFHTAQMYTKTSPVNANGHTGIAVPCLCKKGPQYGKGAPNRWVQGFNWGYFDTKTFSDYITIIIDGQAVINGKHYKG